ncbi:MAG TPA: glycerol kinase GlpK [Chloroflexota bacterium]|nr:glycerol kinase GlpK [Chloroflexota bacterium]
MAKQLLAIDQGTTGTTALVIDEGGSILSRGYAAVTQHYPQPGWVDHDATQIWQTVLDATSQALSAAPSRQLTGIGITNQRETTVLWDRRSGEPLAPAIVWQCRRTASRCDELRAEGAAPLFQERTGLVLDAYFSGTKIEWLLDHVPTARARAEAGDLAFGTIDAWLVYRLTGGTAHVTDVSNASRTLLFDIHRGEWSEELLARLRVPTRVLPEVIPSSSVAGYVGDDAGQVPAGTPIAGIAGDQQAALFGQACFTPGSAKTTYGTGCFLLLNTGPTPVPSRNQLLTTVAWQLERQGGLTYALEGSVFIGGAVVQWLRDELGLIDTAAETATIASSVPDTGGVYLVPAFTGLGAPYWDQAARGAIVGLTRGTGRAHLVRAALEGIAHQVTDVVEAMGSDAGTPLTEMRVDGGAAANDFLMQVQADLLGVPVTRPANLETTAFGAAALAGLTVGVWSSLGEVAATLAADRTFEPRMAPTERERIRAGWHDAVRRTRS